MNQESQTANPTVEPGGDSPRSCAASGSALVEVLSDGSKHQRARRWLVAEYCGHDIYMGWHLYIRDNPGYQKRNQDGGWGWIRGPVWDRDRKNNRMVKFFSEAFGIELKGDWTCPEHGCAEFVKRYPLKGRKVWGEKRGGVEVLEGYWGDLLLFTPNVPLGSLIGESTPHGHGRRTR